MKDRVELNLFLAVKLLQLYVYSLIIGFVLSLFRFNIFSVVICFGFAILSGTIFLINFNIFRFNKFCRYLSITFLNFIFLLIFLYENFKLTSENIWDSLGNVIHREGYYYEFHSADFYGFLTFIISYHISAILIWYLINRRIDNLDKNETII